jgi:biopolymer transport protein ExbD
MRFDPPRPKSDDERILPLINVVFLLLIFFMLAGQLAATDPFDIEPPSSVSENEPGAADIVVLIGADGRLGLDGAILDGAGLRAALAARASDGSRMPEVRVKADGRTPATRVVEVMELLREAGVKKLRLLTVPAE